MTREVLSDKMAFENTPEGKKKIKPQIYLRGEHSREMRSKYSSTDVRDYLVCLWNNQEVSGATIE